MKLEYLRNEVEVDTQSEGYTTTEGGIRVANKHTDYQYGNITALGPKVEGDLKVGDTIVFLTKVLQKIDVSGVTQNFLFEEHVCAKLIK